MLTRTPFDKLISIFDLQMTKDSVLIIMHDPTVNRTADGKGLVSNLPLAEIKQLDAGIKKEKVYQRVQVPTFEETLAIMPRNVWLNCHLKRGVEAVRKATKIISESQRLHQAFLACSKEAAKAARAARDTDNRILICNMDPTNRNDNKNYVQPTLEDKAKFIQFQSSNGLPSQTLTEKLKKNKIYINYFQAKDTSELDEFLEYRIATPVK